MLQYLKKYPLSLLTVAAVLFLSLFNPPQPEGELFFPGLDKLVHGCMYGTLSGLLWIEYLRRHRGKTDMRRVFVGAGVLPIVLGGLIELLQAHLTTYRSGDWADMLANTAGVAVACLIGYFVLRPRFNRS